jgi:DNA (cytosine-5)-methyltransferase 1
MIVIEQTKIAEFDGEGFQIKTTDSVEIKTNLNPTKVANKRDGHFIESKILDFDKSEPIQKGDFVLENGFQQLLFNDQNVPFPPPENPKFKFIDLFAGIGGFRLAMQNLGGKCVFTSEWDLHAQKTYAANFGEVPFGDITKEETKAFIPDDFDVLCAGFPCQAFSIAGKRGGFEDTRGTLFFDVAEIIKRKRPRAIFLENVKGLTTHDEGKTLQIIISTLEELDYEISFKVLNAKDFSVPQDRKRIYIVGFDKQQFGDKIKFEFPKEDEKPVYISQFVEENVVGYSISKHLQNVYIYKKDDGKPQIITKGTHVHAKTLVSTYHKIQRLTSTFVKDGETGLRLLSTNECKSIMGFDSKFIIPVSRTQMYRQLGNSVAVPVVAAVGKKIIEILSKN